MYNQPDELGHFGQYGGRFVPEVLIPALDELTESYKKAKNDPMFQEELASLHAEYIGRPSPLYFAENLSNHLGGAKIYFKREDLNHTGAHKANNALGQALLAKYMGKKRVVAETGAGQHGQATASFCAKLGLECIVYMGAVDVARQRPNVFLMEQFGAKVVAVEEGTKRLKDAANAAIRDWITNVEDSYFLLGSVIGPHPYPMMVRDFQSIIGREIKEQIMKREKSLPHSVIAVAGGGSNAMGMFYEFIEHTSVDLVAVEAGGQGLESGKHAALLSNPDKKIGVVEGFKGYFLMDDDGQVSSTSSVAAGIDYPGIAPELCYLYDKKRVKAVSILDAEVMEAFQLTCKTEGIMPALESTHAIAYACKLAPTLTKEKSIVVNISGRGDKDIFTVAEQLHDEGWKEFIRGKSEEYGGRNF